MLGIVFAMHLVSQVFGLLAAAGGFPLVIVVVLIWLVIFAHYGVVIEETGPEAHDEIPPVLRNVSFYDDFLAPLVSLGVATALCAAPAVGVVVAAARFGVADGPTFLVTVLCAAFGLVAFPAVLLTLTTSGTLHNLLPHRLFGVAARSGPAYAAAVALLLLTLLCYGVGTGLTNILGLLVLDLLAWLFPGVPLVPAFLTTPVGGVITVAGLIGYPLLAAGIYFAHAFALDARQDLPAAPRRLPVGPATPRLDPHRPDQATGACENGPAPGRARGASQAGQRAGPRADGRAGVEVSHANRVRPDQPDRRRHRGQRCQDRRLRPPRRRRGGARPSRSRNWRSSAIRRRTFC